MVPFTVNTGRGAELAAGQIVNVDFRANLVRRSIRSGTDESSNDPGPERRLPLPVTHDVLHRFGDVVEFLEKTLGLHLFSSIRKSAQNRQPKNSVMAPEIAH